MKKTGCRRIVGLILAGGLAERMGKCKLLLPCARSSAIETIATRLREANVEEIIVVTGAHEDKIRNETIRMKCSVVHNPAYKSGMYSSVLRGVKALPADAESFFLLPGDVPLVKTATYRTLVDAFYEGCGNPDVVYPNFRGTRGHPPLIGRELTGRILEWSGAQGLRGLLSKLEAAGEGRERIIDAPTGDRAILLDMDTPDDYAALLKYAESEFFPDRDECEELLEIAGTPPRAARHMGVVAGCAGLIASELERRGAKLDQRLLAAACLLHDIAKGQKEHEAVGARWLRKRGYLKVSRLVASHKDLPGKASKKRISEAEVLYLSDKITDGELVTTLASRLSRMEARFAPGSESLDAARRRIQRAADIQSRVEAMAGVSLAEILDPPK
jgi:CTP:molybdopterin cytidylyltransferase MocA